MESIWFIGISDERSEITGGPEIPCIDLGAEEEANIDINIRGVHC